MMRTKGEAGTGRIGGATPRQLKSDIRRVQGADKEELDHRHELGARRTSSSYVAENGRLPVLNFSAGGGLPG